VPEGDTIHRLAKKIAPALVGQPTTRVWQRDRGEVAELVGQSITAVEAVGKHLLVGLGDRYVLHTHLGMPGRVNQVDGAFTPTWETSAIVGIEGTAFVWRNARTAALVRRDEPAFVRAMQRIGPDLLSPTCDIEDIVARALARGGGERPIADVLLDQSIAAGIGNVFKSEIMFTCGFDPLRAVGTIDREELVRAYELARTMLQSSVRDGYRDTVGVVTPWRGKATSTRLWVYDRAGERCRVCGAAIARTGGGEDARVTFHCGTSQAPETGRRRSTA
jgi:endonuclease-8